MSSLVLQPKILTEVNTIYHLLRKAKGTAKRGTFKQLPDSVKTNRDAILWVAVEFGIEVPTDQEFNEHRFVSQFKSKGFEAICSGGSSFFPHGKNFKFKIKPESNNARRRPKELKHPASRYHETIRHDLAA